MDTLKKGKDCESELMSQGHSREDAKRMCAEQEKSHKKDESHFPEKEEGFGKERE